MSIVLSVANQKGGTGKTSTTIELAACLKKEGYSVLVIDFDAQCNLTTYVTGVEKEKLEGIIGIYEVLSGKIDIKKTIRSHFSSFDLIPCTPAFSQAEASFVSQDNAAIFLKAVLVELSDIYDFILIDTNPSRNILLNMAYIASDYIIAPIDVDKGSITGLKSVFNDVKEYNDNDLSDVKVIGVILTKYERTGLHAYVEDEVNNLLKQYNSDAFFMKVRKSIAVSEVKEECTTLQEGKKFSNPAMDYRKIAKTLNKKVLEDISWYGT